MNRAELFARIRADLSALEALELAPAPAPPLAPVAPPAPAPAPPLGPFTDEGAFYDWLRGNRMLGPKISATEFEGTSAIVSACHAAGWGVGWTADALGTGYLETAGTMLPIKEYGGETYFRRRYDIQGANPTKARELGNFAAGDGAKYAGRGLVQLTGKTNYARAEAKLRALGLLKSTESLVDNPDLALRPDLAAAIMVYGMAEGWFTGKKLADYIPREGEGRRELFKASRRIINGTDRDDDLAGFCVDFQKALLAGGYRRLN